METARAGSGLLDAPFAIDEYEMLPPSILRQNPGYYHSLLKDAGFETEKGWVDYKIEVTPALIARYQSALEAAQRAGFSIAPLKDLDAETARATFHQDMERRVQTSLGRWRRCREEEVAGDVPVLRFRHRTGYLRHRVSRR